MCKAENDAWMIQPALVSVSLIVGHRRKRIELHRAAPQKPNLRNRMHKLEEWCEPRLHDYQKPLFAEYATHFAEGFVETLRQSGEMVQTALHDQDVFGLVEKGKFSAVGYAAFCGPAIEGQETRRQVDSLDICESEARQRVKPIAPSAEKLDHMRITRNACDPKELEALQKFVDLLLRRFKSDICRFPRIDGDMSGKRALRGRR